MTPLLKEVRRDLRGYLSSCGLLIACTFPLFAADTYPVSRQTIVDSGEVNLLTVTSAGAAKVDGSAVTQPISAASLPLPTGASTSALQTTGNASLSSIDAGTPNALGQTTMANAQSVAIASDQSAIPVTQSTSPWVTSRNWTLSSGTDSVSAVQSGTWTVSAVQSTSPWVTSRNWTLSSGTDSIAAVQSGTWNITNISGTVSLPTGAATSANQTTQITNQNTQITSLQLLDDVVGSKAPGTAASASSLAGCVYNSAGVTLTNTQQAACQMTASGAIKVDASFTAVPKTSPSFPGEKYRANDMNVANGGVARGTGIASTSVYTVLYNYTGSGHLFSYAISFEGNLVGADSFTIKLEIDGTINYEITTDDVGTNALYGLSVVQDEASMGFSLQSNSLRFVAPGRAGLYYASSVKISIKKTTSATSKQFRAGLVNLTKET